MRFSVLEGEGSGSSSSGGGCRAGDSFQPTRFVVVYTPPCYVYTFSHLVVGVKVSVYGSGSGHYGGGRTTA